MNTSFGTSEALCFTAEVPSLILQPRSSSRWNSTTGQGPWSFDHDPTSVSRVIWGEAADRAFAPWFEGYHSWWVGLLPVTRQGNKVPPCPEPSEEGPF